MKLPLFFLFILLISLVGVSANPSCLTQNCAFSGGVVTSKSHLTGSNSLNVINESNISFSKCNLQGSLYQPVMVDFNKDGLTDIVTVPSTTKMYVYDMDCQLNHIITTPTIYAQPIITNVDNDDWSEIAVLFQNHAVVYEWSDTNQWFQILVNQSTSGFDNANYWGCTTLESETNCLAARSNSKNLLRLNLTFGGSSQSVVSNAILNAGGMRDAPVYGEPVFTFAEEPDAKFTSICYQNSTANLGNVTCQLFQEDGSPYNNAIFHMRPHASQGYLSATDPQLEYFKSSPVRFQGQTFVFSKVRTVGLTGNESGMYIHDIFGIEKYSVTTNQQVKETFGDWIISDIDKDGSNEVCYPRTEAASDWNNITVVCAQDDNFVFASGGYMFNGSDFNTGMPQVSMAEYFPNSSRLLFSQIDGIWAFTNAGNIFNKIYSTGETGTNTSRGQLTRGLTLPVYSRGGSIGFVYNDPIELNAFVVRNTDAAITCGDGVCSIFESAFTCPADCFDEEIILAACECNTVLDCVSPFNVCHANQCVISNFNQTCDVNIGSQGCTHAEDPVCYSGLCIAGAECGLANLTDQGLITPGASGEQVEEGVTFLIDSLLGTSKLLKFIIGIAIILSVVMAAATQINNGMVVLFVGLMGTILVTVLGFIPSWILVLIIVVALLIAVLGRLLGSASAGAG